jgi:hypothetical protein
MRPKHPLDQQPTLNASGPDGLPGDAGMPARGPVTSFLFLRYRLQSFKVGADILDQDGMIFVI